MAGPQMLIDLCVGGQRGNSSLGSDEMVSLDACVSLYATLNRIFEKLNWLLGQSDPFLEFCSLKQPRGS